MNQRIHWVWFGLSQVVFGIVAGFVVGHQERIRTGQVAPLRVRMGLETPGLADERRRRKEDERP